MNESELRRKELLAQMRNSNLISHEFPAIHPKYGNLYRNLYSQNERPQPKNSFLLRFCLSSVCFLMYISIASADSDIAEVYCSQITSCIQTPFDYEEIQEVWKEL